MSQMTIGDCRVLSNKIAQHLLDCYIISTTTDSTDAVVEHILTGRIAEMVSEYFGVSAGPRQPGPGESQALAAIGKALGKRQA